MQTTLVRLEKYSGNLKTRTNKLATVCCQKCVLGSVLKIVIKINVWRSLQINLGHILKNWLYLHCISLFVNCYSVYQPKMSQLCYPLTVLYFLCDSWGDRMYLCGAMYIDLFKELHCHWWCTLECLEVHVTCDKILRKLEYLMGAWGFFKTLCDM
jgi:hypothetical protein